VRDITTPIVGFRRHYYAVAGALRDDAAGQGRPLVTAGLIDPGRSLWGTRPARIAKADWQWPRADDALLRERGEVTPWLAATALLHSAAVMEKRDALKIWTIFLAILAFSLSLLGTFLVRSGVLTSVHSFATDPQRGVFILAILVFFIGGSLALFALRASALKPGGIFAPVSREGALIVNNLFLAATCAAVLIGTLYPLALEAISGAIPDRCVGGRGTHRAWSRAPRRP
jgi:hypothetical protein